MLGVLKVFRQLLGSHQVAVAKSTSCARLFYQMGWRTGGLPVPVVTVLKRCGPGLDAVRGCRFAGLPDSMRMKEAQPCERIKRDNSSHHKLLRVLRFDAS